MDSATTRKDAPAATKAANKPVKSFRLHGISVSVFANKVKHQNQDLTFHKLSVQKTYRDDEGNLQTTGSFEASDVPVLTFLLNQAYEQVCLLKLADSEASSEE